MLEAGRSPVRFSLSLDFSFDLILPAAVLTQPLTDYLPGSRSI
jgi:hypothetical protein